MKKILLILVSVALVLAMAPKPPAPYQNVRYGFDLRNTDVTKLTQAQIDFANAHYEFIRTGKLDAGIRQAINGPVLTLYASVNGIWPQSGKWYDWDYVNAQESMFWHGVDSPHYNGRIITPFNSYLMNGHSAWSDYYIQTVSSRLNQYNYDAVFVDSCTHYLFLWWTQGLEPVEPYSDPVHLQMRQQFLQTLKAAMPNKKVVFNALHSGVHTYPSLAYADGGMHEVFVFSGSKFDPGVYVGKAKWLEAIEMTNQYKDSKTIRLVGKKAGLISDTAARELILASYLLVASPTVTLASIDLTYERADNVLPFPPEFSLDIGAPVGNYTVNNGLYIREFKRGLVIVNPEDTQSKTGTLNGNYKKITPTGIGIVGADGKIVGGSLVESNVPPGTYVVPPKTGYVLRK